MNQTPLSPDDLAQLIMWKELPFGGNPDNYIKLDSNSAHKVIELLKPHLAVAQPLVKSEEELDSMPHETVIRDSKDLVFERIVLPGGEPEWWGTTEFLDEIEVTLPARVLYLPEVKP